MRILFLINVDWFFASHFLHLAERARAEGAEVVLATEISGDRTRFIDAGLDLIELPVTRGSVLPRGLVRAARLVAADLKAHPGTVISAFGLFGIVVGALASFLSGSRQRVFYITGRGYTAVSPTLKGRLVRLLSKIICRGFADSQATRWIGENTSDIESLCPARAIAEGRTAVAGGAGVDPAIFTPQPFPPSPPLKLLLVGRMIWSKGIDQAVEAVQRARSKGAAVELTIAGGLDTGNPAGLKADDMARFEAIEGVTWLGEVKGVANLWSEHHAAILPSRGGEGVPRSLIEAAACGRPIITTDVPGCLELAQSSDGIAVRSDDVDALADAIVAFAANPRLEARGARARQAVLDHYTEEKNWQALRHFYRELTHGNTP
jgi:glycosyltransferase involved in cell wall biosynthesis